MKKSAGILVYRKNNIYIETVKKEKGKSLNLLNSISAKNNSNSYQFNNIEILLVHPGGPFWHNRDLNSWSIPKGEVKDDEDLKNTAIREFEEETSFKLSQEDKDKILYLDEVRGRNKILYIFILEKDFGSTLNKRGKFIIINWPPKSNKKITIPEIDKVQYFNLNEAKDKLVSYQKPIIKIFKNKLDLLSYFNQEN
ncbi:MAG: NTP pyrophosphohydrolase [Candidatus Parcubacteria bacterium]|nr:MAG: NTP pyrophosphohydrolase [Candidatus Parcubacteria bacterium]